jgi:hypothetical protein
MFGQRGIRRPRRTLAVSLTNTREARRGLGSAEVGMCCQDGYRPISPVSNWDEESYFKIVFPVSFKPTNIATRSLLESYNSMLALACGVHIGRDDSRNKAMKIIRFPLVQENNNPPVSNLSNEISPLLIPYRDGALGELLVWAICVVSAVTSIVLSVSQLQNDANRAQRAHVDRVSINRLADEAPHALEVSKQL